LAYLRERLGADEAAVAAWIRHWIQRAFDALEAEASSRPEYLFAYGDQPGLADICLVPQMYSARRFGVDVSAYQRLSAIDERARGHPAFIAAAPENQKDAQSA
jgi:glutathione S-transferase